MPSRRPLHSLVVLAAVTAVGSFALAPAASADVEHQADPKGDTKVLTAPKAGGKSAKPVDVTRITTAYQGNRIRVTLDVVDLAPVKSSSDVLLEWVARIKTEGGDYFAAYLRQGPQTITIMQPTSPGDPAVPAGCDTPAADFDRAHDRVTVTVSRDCVGATDSVRTGGFAGTSKDETTFRYDYARRRGGPPLDQGSDVPLGPRVRRN